MLVYDMIKENVCSNIKHLKLIEETKHLFKKPSNGLQAKLFDSFKNPFQGYRQNHVIPKRSLVQDFR